MENLEDSSNPTTAMNKALALMAKAFKLNTIPINNNQRSSLITRNSQIAHPNMNMSQDIKIQMVDDNVGNQVRQNVMQNYGNKVGQNAVQNLASAEANGNGINGNPIRCYNCRGEGHYASDCTVKPRKWDDAYLQQQLQIAQKEEAGIQITQAEFEFKAAADAHEETERVKVNCTSEDTLQQASTFGTQSNNAPVDDLDGSTEVPKDENCYDHDIFNMLTYEVQYTDLQTEHDRTKEKLENCINKKEKEYVVLWNNWYTKCEECKYDKISYDKAYNDMQQKIERLQAQLRDLKGKSSDTKCASNTLDLVSQKLKDENVPLESQVLNYAKENAHLKTRYKNLFDSIKVTQAQTNSIIDSLKKQLPNPSKTSRVYNVVPNKHVKTSVRIKPIIVSKPNVIHKQQANSDSNGFSSTIVNNTAKTRRPHPRSNSNTDRVPSKFTVNHDVCALNYVNNMNSRADNQSVNVTIRENQKKYKANAKNSKELGSKGSLASSRPSKPRTCLSTSNPLKTSSKGFPISTSLLGRSHNQREDGITVIVNGDAPAIASASAGTDGLIPPKTAEQKLARKNELKAKSTLLLAIPDEHLLKFHGINDAKTLWEAIKARFGGNKESKKMQKTILKQKYENFATSRSEGLDKTYDRFQKLISQLEIHGVVISQEDANLKLLRSLPSAWNNIALIMRNKSDLDTLSMDDLYNNLKVTNEVVNTAHEVSTASSKRQSSSSTYANDVMFSFFANQSNSPQLDNEDLEQINIDDLEEMDLKWAPMNQGNRNRDAPRRVVPVETPTNSLVVQDGIGGYDWSFQAEEGITNFALMAYRSQGSSSSSSSDSEVHTYSKDCLKSYETLQKQYDQQCEALKKSNLEIIGYQIGLESLEARIVVHKKNEAVYEEDIAFLKYDVQVKDISIKDLKNQLEETLKEKDDLKLKLEKFKDSSKNLTKLINSQISAKDKAGLGYDSQMNESEVVHSVFNSRESDVDDSLVNDRFKTGKGFHAVPPLYTRNYMPSRPDLSFAGLDDYVYKAKVSETITIASKTSKDSLEKPKTVRPSAPIIEDWDTDSDNDSVFRPKPDQTKPKFTKINFVKSDENVKSVNKENTHRQEEYPRKSQSPRDNRRNWNGMMTQKLGNGVNAAKQSSPRAATSISTTRPVNTAAPKSKVNDALPKTYSYFKAHSPVRRAINQKSTAKTNNLNEKVKTAKVNNVTTAGPKAVVSAAKGNRENVVKSSACWIWRPTGNGNPQYTLQDQGIFDSGCSRHMTGNKSFLTDNQEIDGGFPTLTNVTYGTIEEEVYVCQPPGFEDPQFPDKVYKVEKALYGLHQAPRAWYETLSTYLLKNGFRRGTIDKTLFIKKDKGDILLVQVYVDDIIFGSTKKSLCVEFEQMMHKRFQMSSMGELTFFLGLQVKQKDDGIFISQDKYVADILKKFDFVTMKTTSTPIETNKALLKDEEAEDVDVHLYRSMIGSLMYLTASRPDIMFVVCACARFQVTPKVSHLHAVKRIFRYLKGQSKLGLWYPRDSPFDLEAFFDSDYAGASLDRKSTTGGCQFLGKRLISWQCKKQTIVANSTTEAEYVAAANCCGQVLWIQNQMLDYGFNFMNTKIYIDNESTICIVKNPMFHSKTKHIEIKHHFIRDSYEKRLIQVIKIHTDHNVADLLTKAFDVSSIRDKFGNKTGSCKAKHIEYMKCVKSQTPRQAKRGRDTKIPQSGGPPEKVGDEAVHKGEGSTVPVESQHTPTDAPSTSPPHISPTIRIPIRQETKVPQLSSPPHTNVADKAASTGVDVRHGGAATTVTSLDAGPGSGNINKTLSMPYDSPLPRGITLVQINVEDQVTPTKVSAQGEAHTQQDQPEDHLRVLSATKVLADATRKRREVVNVQSYTRRRRAVNTGSGEISTAEEPVSTVGASMPVSTAGIVQESSTPLSVAIKDKAERQRITRVHEEASSFNVKEWKDIQATIEADEELAQRIQHMGSHTLKQLKRLSFDELKALFENNNEKDPTDDNERTLRVELKRLFEPDTDDILWKLQRYMHDPLTWRLYDTCGVHHVSTDRLHDIFMLVEKDYPLTRGLLTLMLCNKMQVDQYSEMADELLRKIVILANRPRQ
ncbi:putative ribonuclease H-like domain-containing protein [Tanacetum coccineum]